MARQRSSMMVTSFMSMASLRLVSPIDSMSICFIWQDNDLSPVPIVPIRDIFSVSKIAFGWLSNRFYRERKAFRHLSRFISLLPDDVMSWSKPWLIPIEIYRPFRTTRSSNDLRSHEDLFSLFMLVSGCKVSCCNVNLMVNQI